MVTTRRGPTGTKTADVEPAPTAPKRAARVRKVAEAKEAPSEPPVGEAGSIDAPPGPEPEKEPLASSSSSSSKAAFPYEFGGPLGAAGIIIGLPVVVLALHSFCTNNAKCIGVNDIVGGVRNGLTAAKDLPSFLSKEALSKVQAGFWNVVAYLSGAKFLQAFRVYVGWFVFQVLLERLLWGDTELGVLLSTGERLPYKVNGHLAFWISLVFMGHGVYPTFLTATSWEGAQGIARIDLTKAYDYYGELAAASILFSFLLAIGLYLASFRQSKPLLALGGKSGNHLYDFYIGRELNPRTGGFDWKYFCELRPGLIGWAVLNLAMLVSDPSGKQLLSSSASIAASEINWPLLLVVILQGVYVWDALFHEKAILTTMDITTDGFGFMLVFGDLAWVPFTYSLQAKYLVGKPNTLPTWALVLITGLSVAGYLIFRGANSTKDAFRRDPALVPHIKYMQTASGRKLMVSGWWGWARKINYTGDWLMGLSWCLLCGSDHVVPYFYATYFLVLLVHRALRDDHACAEKYGDDWVAYKKAVPYLFVPKVF